MRHIFIVNPKSGKGNVHNKFMQELREREAEVYLTKSADDAERYIRNMCESNSKEYFRFYSCGGDGTLNNVLNGIVGFDNAEAAAIPLGSGNDFIRSFGLPAERFSNIDAQLSGSAVTVDVIKYQDVTGNAELRYAFNMFNIGFDCDVVVNMTAVKKIPFVRGAFAYLLSILLTLIKKEGAELDIDFDDGTNYNGRVLFTTIGNGAYCGGGIKGLPNAELDDGLMDVCVVKDVSRRVIFSLLPKYAKGTHLETEIAKEIIDYKKCKSLTVKNCKDKWFISVDGEINTVGKVHFEIVPNAVRFSLPSTEARD